jgi:drug/metabolite transporter (DMT)-like permease
MLILGLLSGLITALGTSICYVLNRHYVAVRGGGAMRLMVISHVQMGVAAGVAVWAMWHEGFPPWRSYWLDVLGAGGFYLAGQATLYVALRHTDASHVTPLLGMKIVVVALIMRVGFGQAIGAAQWAAVGLCVGSAFLLNKAGASGALPGRALAAIGWTCAGYALSDISIQRLVTAMEPAGAIRGPLAGSLMCYAMCGVVSAAMLPWHGSRRLEDWRAAAPYSALWLAAMSIFFVAVAGAGVVLANIILATRGLISIGLGVALSRRGMVHLEKRVHRDVLARRIAAAGMMLAAICLYTLG